MAPPQRLWSVGVVLAFLWMRSFECSTEVDNSSPTNAHDLHKRYIDSNGNYEVVDVMSHNGQKDNGENGQTMRIVTTGDVGDDFWLKYLGEDFKNAIHLQVGDNAQHEAIYNNAMNATQQRYSNSEAQNKHPVEEQILGHAEGTVKNETTEQNQRIESKPDNLRATSLDTDASASYEEKEREEQSESEDKKKSTNSKPANHKYKKVQLNEKEKPTTNFDKESKRKHKKVENDSHESPYRSVVVNLPDSKKDTQEYDKSDTPVVVKMPPVIYHQRRPAYREDDNVQSDEDSQKHTQTHQHTYSHSYQNAHIHIKQTHNTEPQYPQHYSHLPHQTYQSHQPQHISQNQAMLMQQQQNQHQNQPSSQMYSQYNTGVYNSPPFEDTAIAGSSTYRFGEMMDADTSSRYMMDKAPGAYDPSTGYSRVGRSNQELFQQGL